MNQSLFKFITCCLFFGGLLFYRALKKHRQARKIQDTPKSKSASAPQGLVELEGFAWPATQTHPTVSGLEAVYYAFRLEKLVTEGHGKNRKKKWVTAFTKYHGESFYLADATGLALIQLADAEINLESTRTRAWRSLADSEQVRICESIVTEDVAEFPPSNFLFGIFARKFRIVENEIYVGSPIYAQGDFKSDSGIPVPIQSTGLTQFASQVFDEHSRATKKPSGLMDKNKDGQISSDEGRFGYTMMARVAVNKTINDKKAEKDFLVHGHVFSSSNHKLLLSDSHELHLVERLQKYLWLQFAGGAALIALGLTLTVNPNLPQKLTASSPKTTTSSAVNSAVSSAGRSPAAQTPSPAEELHYQCLGGVLKACEKLIDQKETLALTADAIKYYKYQSCRLGQVYCL